MTLHPHLTDKVNGEPTSQDRIFGRHGSLKRACTRGGAGGGEIEAVR